MRVLQGEKRVAVTSLAFSPDGRTLAAGLSGRVDLWDVAAGTARGMDMFVWGAPPDNIRFDPSGKWLLWGFGWYSGLRLIDVRRWAQEKVGTFDVNHLAVSRTGQVLAGGGRINSFRVLKRGLGARQWAKPLGAFELGGLDFYPDGEQFATVESTFVPGRRTVMLRVRAAGNGRVEQEAACDCREGGMLRVSPDGRWVAFLSAKSLLVHHGVELTRAVKIPNASKKAGTGLAFHPSGRYLAATGGDAAVRLHDRDADWAVVRTLDWQIGALKSVAFSPDGSLAAAGGQKGRVVVWDVDG